MQSMKKMWQSMQETKSVSLKKRFLSLILAVLITLARNPVNFDLFTATAAELQNEQEGSEGSNDESVAPAKLEDERENGGYAIVPKTPELEPDPDENKEEGSVSKGTADAGTNANTYIDGGTKSGGFFSKVLSFLNPTEKIDTSVDSAEAQSVVEPIDVDYNIAVGSQAVYNKNGDTITITDLDKLGVTVSEVEGVGGNNAASFFLSALEHLKENYTDPY